MSKKHYEPLPCCDHDCAAANNCTMGGVECHDCGSWYCPVNEGDDDGRCDDCAARHRRELEEEEQEQEAEDGE